MSITKKDIGSWVQWRLFAVAVIISLWWFVWREPSANKIVQSPSPTVQVAGGGDWSESPKVEAPRVGNSVVQVPNVRQKQGMREITDPTQMFTVQPGETVRFHIERTGQEILSGWEGSKEKELGNIVFGESTQTGIWVTFRNPEPRPMDVYVAKKSAQY